MERFEYRYDTDADALSIVMQNQKSEQTVEWAEHIMVDITKDWKLVGIEIVDASAEISRLFNRAVSKDEIKHLLCEVTQEPKNEYLVQFKSADKKESANLLIPLYRSPITYA